MTKIISNDPLKLLDSLWGGIIYSINIDLLLHYVSIYIRLEDQEGSTYYELKFREISIFNIKDEKVFPWEKVELTEVYCSKNEYYTFEIILWDEIHMITIVCKDFECNQLNLPKQTDR